MLKGHLSYLHTVASQNSGSPLLIEGNLHNRIDAAWRATGAATLNGSLRTRLLYGDFVEQSPDYGASLSQSTGYFKLSRVLDDGPSWLLHSEIDRLYGEAGYGAWQVVAGRQRINWGLNLVWNPHDLFNAYSLFDVDYPERPGTDAVSVEYYPSETSNAQLVWQAGETLDSMAFAGRYRRSVYGYDIQAIGGLVKQDLVAGGGWSGAVAGGAFRGEAAWFHPTKAGAGSTDIVSACVSGDYTFSWSLYAHAAFLYTSNGSAQKTRSPATINDLLSLSAKKLSTSRYSCLGQVSYPVTPLVNADLTGVINPIDHSFYACPTVRVSVSDNSELSLLAQVFEGKENSEFGAYGMFAMGRFRWSF
ncbi:MAG: hypothetical protein JXA71_08455 [Chitinispirillaceae bacterium]|nr:hypothetical protein [Chitinispirillaceae bacterium]